jgi:TctA family transporter
METGGGNSFYLSSRRVTLMDGVGFVPVIMGIFGIPEVLENIEVSLKQEGWVTGLWV